MKTKAKKRLEAIQRLERPNPVFASPLGIPNGDGTIRIAEYGERVAKRHLEAKRLREVFKL